MVRLAEVQSEASKKKSFRSPKRNPRRSGRPLQSCLCCLEGNRMAVQQYGIHLHLYGSNSTAQSFAPLILTLPTSTTLVPQATIPIFHNEPLTFTSNIYDEPSTNEILATKPVYEDNQGQQMIVQEMRDSFEADSWAPFENFSYAHEVDSQEEVWKVDPNQMFINYEESFNMESPYFDQTIRRRAMGFKQQTQNPSFELKKEMHHQQKIGDPKKQVEGDEDDLAGLNWNGFYNKMESGTNKETIEGIQKTKEQSKNVKVG